MNIFNSTLPRQKQIQRYAQEVTDAWIAYLMRGDCLKPRNFCLRLGIPLVRNEMTENNKRECELDA